MITSKLDNSDLPVVAVLHNLHLHLHEILRKFNSIFRQARQHSVLIDSVSI